jgi:hypothetical protein
LVILAANVGFAHVHFAFHGEVLAALHGFHHRAAATFV